jgi:iron complex outermembrane receptor protein
MARVLKPSPMLAALLAILAAPVAADDGGSRDDASTLSIVVVRAQREEAQVTPASRTRIDGTAIERSASHDLAALADQIPNLRLSSEGGRASQGFVSLRGFINPWSAPEAAVALRVDGVPMNDLLAFNQRLFDVDRVDVWQGPQGTHSGSNAEAGLIDIVTRRPDDETRAAVGLGLASRGGFETSANAAGPIAPNLFGSLAAVREGSDGQIDNRVGARPYDAQDGQHVRARLLWQPNHASELDATVLHDTVNDHGGEQYLSVDRAAFDQVPTLGGLQLGRYEQAIDHEGDGHVDATLAALKGSWNGESVHAVALASWRSSKVANSTDYDLSPQPWFVMDSAYDVRERHVESRLESLDAQGPWHWLGGISVQRRDFDTLRVFNAGPGNSFQLPSGPYVRTDAGLHDRNTALFGEVSRALDAAQRWTIGLGTRLQWAQRELGFGANAVGAPAAQEGRGDRLWLPKFSLDYRPNPAWHAYASLAQGGKPGGYNPGVFAASQASFRAEHTQAAEFGVEGGSDTLHVQLAAFHNRIRDYQDLTLAESEFTTYLRNVERATTQGLDAQARWQIDEHWRFDATAGQVRAVYARDVLDSASGFGLQGHRLPQVPRYNGRLALQYRRDPWWAEAAWNGASDYRINDYDASTGVLREATIPGYRTVDLGAGYRRGHWSINAYARNLTDRRYFTSATFGFAALALYPGAMGAVAPRRTLGVALRWDY